MNLVTGATGFVGSYIVRALLKQGVTVRALKRKSSNTDLLKDVEGKFEWFEADVLDTPALKDAMVGIDYVYHSAAMISFVSSEAELMHKINIEGTANVVNACLDSDVKKLIHISSVSAFGRYEMKFPINEKTSWKDHDDNTQYAISKFRSEMEVWRGIEEGLDANIVNPSTIIGFGDWTKGSCQIFKNVHDGISFYPTGLNGFVAVEDVARICIELMESNISSEQFIVSAENRTFKEIFFEVAKAFNIKPPSKPVSPFLASIGWRLYWLKSKLSGQQPLVTKETTTYTARDYEYVNDKVKNALNFEFKSIDEAIDVAAKKYAH